ncbi:MAG: shikimate dehydrogenase [Chitinophagales bacterium]|jgi:shikimate dehydrogenase|nr:shikimate dehydrogenase [Bacteroidota bacterium]MBK7569796.1 shikimate dehydrogenase [Bacteroidota bacterium]MBP8915398.1 shikimate dehydrogenase [Chitinophagales bacterium]MBP9220019.1 shikimate dehydrogenase [Chitinophagales bacterium]MBP9794833.1 shikimate dehydrogenase [Chitinophagales bacterium]
MRKFGLIGYPLTHSFSEKYFAEKFEKEEIEDSNYSLFPLENIEDVRFLFEVEKDLHGLNVTIPYKETVIQYLDDLDNTAQKIGAVNCIKIDEIQKVGYNTDYAAFRDSLKPLLKTHHKKALILGTGGASKAVNYALQELNIQPVFVSRNKSENNFIYSELTGDIIAEYPVIINCTPTGMYPAINVAPEIPYQSLSKNNLLFDLIYNPEKTLFLQQGEKQGSIIKNGLEMLQLQAEYAWEIWNTEQE